MKCCVCGKGQQVRAVKLVMEDPLGKGVVIAYRNLCFRAGCHGQLACKIQQFLQREFPEKE